MLSYSSWGERGIFTPVAQWLGCICWIEYWKKKSVIFTVTANQLYAVVIQTVDVKLNPIGRKLECNRSVNVSSSHLFSDRYVNFLSGHSRTQWTSGFNSHLWKRSKIIYSMFPWFWCAELFSSEWNSDEFDLPLFFGYLVLGCSYQNLCWSSGVLFFSSLFKLYRTPTCKTWYNQEDFNGLWCERLLNIFFGLRFFLLIFLGGKGNSLLCTSISKAPVS